MRFYIAIILFFLMGCEEASRISYPDPASARLAQEISNRLVTIKVKHRVFWDNKIHYSDITVLDVCAKSVMRIFDEISKLNGKDALPIYALSCYAPRLYSKNISLHQYAGAIDVNYYMNPYVILSNGTFSTIPAPLSDKNYGELCACIRSHADRYISDEELKRIINKYFIAEADCEDCFINRLVVRPGMLTAKHAEIFAKNGFDIWGGRDWRKPIDSMHFQMSRSLAEKLFKLPPSKAQQLWNKHLKEVRSKVFSPVKYHNWQG